MNKIYKILLLAIILSVSVADYNEASAQTANVNFSIFYNTLKAHGRWMNNSSYGQVWISNDRSFVPYQTGGHWAYTDYGWTWVSDYDWGWGPFHYGRWNYNSSYGWYWVPGYEWAPAWVAWRGDNDYYGWAPLSPGLSIGVNVNTIPSGRWVFAPHRYITSPSINRYYVPRTRNVTIIKNTTVVNNVTIKNNVHYDGGPRREDVERVNRTKIKTYTVSNSTRPGKTVVNNNTVNVYRPVINNDKTVINKNNNNTTVNKNSNNKTVNKNTNKTTVNNKQTTVKNSDNKTTIKNSNNKTVDKTTNKLPVKKNDVAKKQPEKNNKPDAVKQQPDRKPAANKPQKNQVNNNKQKVKPQQNKPQQKQNNEVAKKKNPDHNDKKQRK